MDRSADGAGDRDPARRDVDGDRVAPRPRRRHASALPHGHELDRVEGAEGEPGLRVDDVAGVQLDPGPEEPFAPLRVVDEADVLAVGLGGGAQPQPRSFGAHLRLGHVAHGQHNRAEL